MVEREETQKTEEEREKEIYFILRIKFPEEHQQEAGK